MEKVLFNSLSKQASELKKTAVNTLIAYVSNYPNKTYLINNINDNDIITTYDIGKYAFVGCSIKTKNISSANIPYEELMLLGYRIEEDTILFDELYELSLWQFDNIQLLNFIQYINEKEFSDD